MGILTILRYLCGMRGGILAVAKDGRAVWLGLLFVLSAGFAREYDGEDLLHEPWHVLLPLAVSLATSTILFVLLELEFAGVRREPGVVPGWLARYRSFLGLYWMMAPLAWLYAVPVERFLDVSDAVRVNLAMLGIVAVWRVLLMVRVVSVVYARSVAASFFVVMLFADTVAVIVFWMTELPIVSIMGGIRLTESESLIWATGQLMRLLTAATWIVWFIGAGMAAVRSRGRGEPWGEVRMAPRAARPISWPLRTLAAGSLLVWAAVLPFTQGEQIHRRRAESDLRNGRIEEAVAFMSQRRRDEFPPHWEPPPRFGYGETEPSIVDILLYLEQVDAPQWVKQLFREKLAFQSRAYTEHAVRTAIWLNDMDDEKLARYVALLESLPEGPAMAVYHRAEIQTRLHASGTPTTELSDERRAILESLLQLDPRARAEPGGSEVP